MIPKTIHYCWFGGNELPPLAKKCIKSWKKYCKGYKIIRWDESNFDISSTPLYVRQAYEAKKWAFVTDYVRLWAMTKYGGIYMDTDVEVVKPIDKFLKHQAFSGFESDTDIPTGIMACEKDFPLFLELLKYYKDAVFIKADGSYNLIDNVATITRICSEKGLIRDNTFQVVDGFALYPTEFFCPINMSSGKYDRSENTVTIHWFNGSWLPSELQHKKQDDILYYSIRDRRFLKKRRKKRIRIIAKRALGEKLSNKIKDRIAK